MSNIKGMALLLFLIFSHSPVFSATYYVDYVAGSDTNNGTATGTPFKHCPGDSNATNTAASTTFAAGDIIKFKGGVTYLGSFTMSWSGDTGNSITYDGNHSVDWGVGRAIIDGQNVTNIKLIDGANADHIVIKGFGLTRAGGYANDNPVLAQTCSTPVSSVPNGYGIYFGTTNNDLVIQNIYAYEIGQWRAQAPFYNTGSVSGTGIFLLNATNVEIYDSEFTKLAVPIGMYAGSSQTLDSINVHDNKIHNNINWGMDLAPQGNSAVISNINLHHNKIYDYYEFDLVNWNAAGGCGSDSPHTDGIFLRSAGPYTATWSNVNIYGNSFWGDSIGAITTIAGTASIFISAGPSVSIYNNEFKGTYRSVDISVDYANYSGSKQTVRIYNNSWLLAGSIGIKVSGEVDDADRDVFIENNIFESLATAANSVNIFIADLAPTLLNNNLYHSTTNAIGSDYVAYYLGGYKLFSGLTALGFEADGAWISPKYTDVSHTLGTASSSNDLSLQSDSPAIGIGAVLSVYFTVDHDGVARGSVWDIGAYEFEPPPPFQSLTTGTGKFSAR